MHTLFKDILYGIRRLLKRPSLTVFYTRLRLEIGEAQPRQQFKKRFGRSGKA